MARDTELRTRLTVDDEGSRDIDAFAKKLAALEGDEATVVLALQAAAAQRELKELLIDISKLDQSDPTIDVKIEQANAAKSELDGLQAKIKEINGTPVDIDTKPAKGGIDDLGKSADSSKSVLANMVGNTTQDLGQLGGVAGSAGVAIGQIGEYAADAFAGGDKLGQLLTNFGKVAGPIAAVGVGVALLTDHLQDVAKTKAWHTDQVEKYTKAVREGRDAVAELAEEQKQAGKVEYIDDGDVKDLADELYRLRIRQSEFLAADQGQLATYKERYANIAEQVRQLNQQTSQGAGLNATELAQRETLIAIMRDYGEVIKAVEGNLADFAATEVETAENTFVFGEDAATATTHAEELQAGLASLKKPSADFAKEIDNAGTKAADTADDIDLLGRRFDELRGRLDFKQAALNFSTAFHDAQVSIAEGTALTEQDIIDLQNEYLGVAETIGDTPLEVEMNLAAIEQGDIDGVLYRTQVALDKTQGVTIPVWFRPKNKIPGIRIDENGNVIATPGAAPTTAPMMVGATARGATSPGLSPVGRSEGITVPVVYQVSPAPTIHVTVPRGYREVDAATAAHRLAKRSGRLYAGRR